MTFNHFYEDFSPFLPPEIVPNAGTVNAMNILYIHHPYDDEFGEGVSIDFVPV